MKEPKGCMIWPYILGVWIWWGIQWLFGKKPKIQ